MKSVTKPERTLTTLHLVVIGFFWTSGGFYGSEPVMSAGPPFYVLVLCLALPLLYSLPTALLSAELATNYPETGGQCVYVTLACGSVLGAHNSWWVFASTVFDSALYPLYLRDSIKTELLGSTNNTNTTNTSWFGPVAAAPPFYEYTYDDTPHGMSPASNYGMSPARNMDYYTDYRNNGTTDAIVEEIEKDLLLMVDYLPIIVICLITLINLAGVDWLMRFESFLGLMALLPCLVFLGFGFPIIRSAPLVEMHGRDINWSEMISKSLWLYGGFTNLGVLAGEAITPRRSYLTAVAVLVPLKILLRFIPFLIAYSNADREGGDFNA